MKKQIDMTLRRGIAVLLCIIIICPLHVQADETDTVVPMASYYLTSYQTYVYPAGGGKVQVWFDVTADNYMDDLGALSIWIYESTDNSTWTEVASFFHEDHPTMLDHNDYTYMSHVSYDGVKGRYYKAYVCIWAGRDGGGDTRYLWTSSKKAT